VSFADPYLLVGLVAVPLAALAYALVDRRRARQFSAWSRHTMLPNIVRRSSRRLRLVPLALFLLALTFLLAGFARPQRVVDADGRGAATIVLAVDVSGSMDATDVAPTRLRAARELAREIVDRLPPTVRVGVVTFANDATLVAAPTFDRRAAAAALPTRVAPLGGTAIGDGIVRAVATIVRAAGQQERGGLERPGAVILLSDGEQTSGGTKVDEAIVSSLVDAIPVDTIAIGTARGVVTQPVRLPTGRTTTQIRVPVHPATLRRIAAETKGRFFEADRVVRSPDALTDSYASLNRYAPAERTTKDLSRLAAGIALVLMVAGITVSGLRLGRVA
jgi:Ca-activated chloride channel family protein